MIADGLSRCGKMGLRLDCLLRGNLFAPRKRFSTGQESNERSGNPCGRDARRFNTTDTDSGDLCCGSVPAPRNLWGRGSPGFPRCTCRQD